MLIVIYALLFFVISTTSAAEVKNVTSAKFSQIQLYMELNQHNTVNLSLTNPVTRINNTDLIVKFNYQIGSESNIVTNLTKNDMIIYPISDIVVYGNDTGPYKLNITTNKIGYIYIGVYGSDSRLPNNKSIYCKVMVVYSENLEILDKVIGWIYFIAWTVSFYPQVILNVYKRSVIGLNFDFLVFNWLGFMAYSIYNVGLYWVEPLKDLFRELYPRSVIPVQLNDVFFGLHAVVITSLQLFLCLIFDRGNQRVSRICWIITSVMVVYIVIIIGMAASPQVVHFNWLDFINYISYLKLFITLIKYIPQAFMNYKRKSTVGWHIGNVMLDFTGGTFSILQMIIISYNNNDWKGFFTDPTKFGLGLFSILFDTLFMVQHYILYKNPQESVYQILEKDSDDENYIDISH